MRSLLLAISLISTIFMAGFAQAEGKVAVVNFEQAILNTDIAKAEIEKIEADKDYQNNIAEAEKIQKEGAALLEKYKKEAPTLSPEQKADLEAKIKAKQSDMQHVAGKLQETKKQVLGKLMYQMRGQAMKAAQEIIDKQGIGLLLNANPEIVLHADTSFDVTAKVTEALNKAAKK